MPSAKERIDTLRDELNRHNRLYYVDAKPEISDHDYDVLMRELIALEQANPQFKTPDSPSQRVGGEPAKEFRTVRHAVPMMSIDNVTEPDELRDFDKFIRRDLGEQSVSYVLEPKVDGIAISLRYEAGVLVLAATRGDGREGDDITANARVIQSIPLKLADTGHPDVLEIRGEIFMSNRQFELINEELSRQKDAKPFMNPRNATAGTLKNLDPKVVAERRLEFVAHGLGEIRGSRQTIDSYAEWLQRLERWWIPTNEHIKRTGSIDEALLFIREFDSLRGTLDYHTDGMVIKVDSIRQREILGETAKSPRWVRAFKYPPKQTTTVLRRVEWQVGKTGTVTPVAVLEPVLLDGTIVTHASLHNRDQIARLDLHLGDMVIVEKKGEIIPQIVGVGARQSVPIPSHCPSCKTPLKTEPVEPGMVGFRCVTSGCKLHLVRRQLKNLPATCAGKDGCGGPVEAVESMVNLFCPNPTCQDKIIQQIRHFASRTMMNIASLGEGWAEQLVQAGLLSSVADIYRLKDRVEELSKLKRVAKKKIEALLDGIEKSRSQPLSKLIAALTIGDVGLTTAENLAARFESMERLAAADEKSLEIPDLIGAPSAKVIRRYFESDEGNRLWRDLQSLGVNMTEPRVPLKESGPLWGKRVVVTGSVPDTTREEMHQAIRDLGGEVQPNVTDSTDQVVVGDKPGAKKIEKATELGKPIMPAGDVLALLPQQHPLRLRQKLPTWKGNGGLFD